MQILHNGANHRFSLNITRGLPTHFARSSHSFLPDDAPQRIARALRLRLDGDVAVRRRRVTPNRVSAWLVQEAIHRLSLTWTAVADMLSLTSRPSTTARITGPTALAVVFACGIHGLGIKVLSSAGLALLITGAI
jgi:hypothetical protein